MTVHRRTITEGGLPRFRAEHLSPDSLLDLVEQGVYTLIRVGVGVGKSYAVDELLLHELLYERFDLVVYLAPTRAILAERKIVSGEVEVPVPYAVLEPRPVERCGAYAKEWEDLERRGCSILAKAKLCAPCQKSRPLDDKCPWPKQFKHLKKKQLLFATEQYVVLNRSLIAYLRFRLGAQRILVILDEAKLLDTNYEVAIALAHLSQLEHALKDCEGEKGVPPEVTEAWVEVTRFLREGRERDITAAQLSLPPALHRQTLELQAAGVDEFGDDFRYAAYDVAQLAWSRPQERWRDPEGTLRFIARPYLGCHALILSAHLNAQYVQHRLGGGRVLSPFEDHRFQHSETSVFNLKNRVGADRHFDHNHRQILDTIAVLVYRNVTERRSTVLVSRKKSKAFCVEYLRERLAGWGMEVEFITDDWSRLPERPDPRVIPIIHYGMMGVNDFEEYESVYCASSYYVNGRELNRAVQETQPKRDRVRLQIVYDSGRNREVVVAPGEGPDRGYARLGNTVLRRLEVDPVIQAAGRVRFLTRPREVVFFQMNDIAAEVGECRDVSSLAELREILGVVSGPELGTRIQGQELLALREQGVPMTEAARRLGLSRRTAYRRLEAAKCVKSPIYINTYRGSDTLPAGTAGQEVPR